MKDCYCVYEVLQTVKALENNLYNLLILWIKIPFFQCQMSSYTSLEVVCLRPILILYPNLQDRDSSVGIPTRYWLDRPEIESLHFLHPSRPFLGSTQPHVKWETGHFPESKVDRQCLWPTTLSSTEVKERVQLYFYSSSGHSWPILRWNLPLPYL